MPVKVTFAFFFLFLLTACGINWPIERSQAFANQHYVGMPIEALVGQWGPPDTRISYNDGMMYEYRYKSSGKSYSLTFGQETEIYTCRARISISRDHIVERIRLLGDQGPCQDIVTFGPSYSE